MSTNPNQITLRLPDGMRGQIQQQATDNHRTLNSQLIVLIERGMQAMRSEEKQSGNPQS